MTKFKRLKIPVKLPFEDQEPKTSEEIAALICEVGDFMSNRGLSQHEVRLIFATLVIDVHLRYGNPESKEELIKEVCEFMTGLIDRSVSRKH